MEFRHAVRPAYVASARWRSRPIGAHSSRYGPGGRLTWSWTCRLDCWAQLTSGWYLRSQAKALEEGLEHLHAYHFPERCSAAGCQRRHVWWPTPEPWRPDEPSSYPSHLDVWHPVVPLLNDQVTDSYEVTVRA